MINATTVVLQNGFLPKLQVSLYYSVSEDLLCKKCNLVARRLTLTSCCGESFCQACIADIQEHGQPCPECETNEFTFFEHGKKSKKNPLLKSLLQVSRSHNLYKQCK